MFFRCRESQILAPTRSKPENGLTSKNFVKMCCRQNERVDFDKKFCRNNKNWTNADNDQKLRIYDAESGQEVFRYETRCQFSPIFYEQLFRTNVFCAAFMCLQFGFVILWQKAFGAKAALKTLVKLTPGFLCPQSGLSSIFSLQFIFDKINLRI